MPIFTLIPLLIASCAYSYTYNQLIGIYTGTEAENVILERLVYNRRHEPKFGNILLIDDDSYFKLVLSRGRRYTSALLFINTENEAHLELLRIFSNLSRRYRVMDGGWNDDQMAGHGGWMGGKDDQMAKNDDWTFRNGNKTAGNDGSSARINGSTTTNRHIQGEGTPFYFFYCNIHPVDDSWFLETQGVGSLPEILVVGPKGQAYSFNRYVEDLTREYEVEWSVEVLERLIEAFLTDCMNGEWDVEDGKVLHKDIMTSREHSDGQFMAKFTGLTSIMQRMVDTMVTTVDKTTILIFLILLTFILARAILRSSYGRYIIIAGSYAIYFFSISCLIFSLVNRVPLYDPKGSFYLEGGRNVFFRLIKWPNIDKLFSKDRVYQYGLEGIIFSLILFLAAMTLLHSVRSEDESPGVIFVVLLLFVIYRLFVMKNSDHVLYVLPPRTLPRGWLIKDRQGIF